MHRRQGFTLIELMVVVAIVAILAAVAVPAYGRYAYRARRVDGQELLLRIAQAQERHYTVHQRYGDLPSIGFSAATDAASEKGYYVAQVELTDTQGTAQGYVAMATPQAIQAKDACGNLSIDSMGRKLPAASDISRNTNGACW